MLNGLIVLVAPCVGFEPQYKGGSSKAQAPAQPKQQMSTGYDTAGSMSGPGAHGLSYRALPPPPPPAGFNGGYSSPSSQGNLNSMNTFTIIAMEGGI